ncbi:predicted protein [Arabidopsis lyrata subsp. lyrata]|uniref:non-specific serine/threonine protein kinase n=1 Tax=Arabidopsis lyrata subsp. lyrata TaxID=81972 RepID=D7LIA6_ARALL|nr:predicted protein [Arabidopsis lyrata subsp. lyrata]
MWKRLDSLLPRDTCGLYNRCGAYGLCDTNTSPNCVCIHGFQPRDKEAWDLHDWTGGCTRKTPLNCSRDGFEQLRTMKLPDITKSIVDRSIGLKECHGKCIGNCNCTAYANTDMQNGGSGCVIWVEEILDLRKNAIAGQDLFVRLAATDISTAQFKKDHHIHIGGLQCAPMDLEHIVNATEKFSDCNKIGQGGFGIVYKGILLDGQAIAAKRLLKRSAQGIEGFITELKLIASFQHINLVKLVGYCFEGDKTQSSKLDWEKRLDITNGIARGLLYLHQYSRYRILHRDLKPSNILLDKDMVPKISDFGMVKLFKRDETEASTTKMIGTFGYMAPEYVIDRKYSVKSDVFSFGVLVLEVISGKRNAEFYLNEETLLSYIWRHWKEGKGLEIVDPVIVDSSSTFRPHEVLRCIQIGLLCVQDSAEDRPAMSSVILMLTSEKTEMNQPERPGSLFSRSRFEIGSSSSKQQNEENWTVPDVTNSTLSGR